MDLRSLALLYVPSHLPANPGNSPKRHGPQVQKEHQAGLFHSGSRVLYVCGCVSACMYTGDLCASMYKGGGVITVTEAGAGVCSRQGLPGQLAHK